MLHYNVKIFRIKGGAEHKSALFLLGGSSGRPQTKPSALPPLQALFATQSVRQPAHTCCRKSQSTLGPLGPQTTQRDSPSISLIKPRPGNARLPGQDFIRKSFSRMAAKTARLKETQPTNGSIRFIHPKSARRLDINLKALSD